MDEAKWIRGKLFLVKKGTGTASGAFGFTKSAMYEHSFQ